MNWGYLKVMNLCRFCGTVSILKMNLFEPPDVAKRHILDVGRWRYDCLEETTDDAETTRFLDGEDRQILRCFESQK